jgi:hypothetical protein
MIRLAGIPVVMLVTTVAWTTGLPGVAYVGCWIAVCAPGVPLGIRILGRGAAGLVAGTALGYATTALAWWAVIASHVPSPMAFGAAWAAGAALLAIAAAAWRAPAHFERTWTRRDTAAFCLVLALVPLLMAGPFHNLGYRDSEGRRYYRAYFTADFVWHMALTAELSRFEMPPRNPYMAERPLVYYWAYFIVPATLHAIGPRALGDVEAVLEANAIGTALVLVGAFYCFAATATRRRSPAVLGVALVILASSAEGLALMLDLLARGRSFAELRGVNIDAVTAWWYNGLRVDGVHRTMFYTPQHGLSCAFGLLAVTVAAAAGARGSIATAAAAGLLLGGATLFNPFLGMAFCVIYALAVIADLITRRAGLKAVLPHVAAAVPPVAAVAWGVLNGMSEGAGQALTVGWTGHARHAPAATILLSMGPVLMPALAGFLPDRRIPAQPARTAAAGLATGLFLFEMVMLTDRFWVGFRAGQILLAMTTVPLARVLDRIIDRGRTRAAALLVGSVLAAGFPTTAIDVLNAADIGNRRMGPGFPWTVTLSPAEQEALAWVRRATPRSAVVQAEPIVRGRTQWSLIPSFAERRMAAGLPISLLPTPEYGLRSTRVRAIFTVDRIDDAHAIARDLRIDYLWVDQTDRAAYPAGVARLASDPTLFTPVFRNAEVTVYGVK